MRLFVALALVTGGCGGDDPEPDPVAADLAGVDAPSFDVELPEADAPPSDTIEDGTAPPPDPGGEDPGVEDLPPPPEDTGPTAWRSALYPVDWTPATTDQEGRFLHDFSWAGYHNGGAPLPPSPDVGDVDVVQAAGADPAGLEDSTAAIQAAIDGLGEGGGVVWFPAGLYRITGTLSITQSGVVLAGEGAESSRLLFTQSEGLSYQAHVTFDGGQKDADEVLLVADAASRDRWVEVADVSVFAPGDDVALGWVITSEFVAEHGMIPYWQAFNDKWQPFFWRTVVSVDAASDPPRVELDVPLRYPALLRDAASLRRQVGTLSEVGVRDLGFANATSWEAAWAENQVHVVKFNGVKDAFVVDVASFESPDPSVTGPVAAHLQSSGLEIRRSKRVTVADTTLGFSQHRGGGGNGYLFEVRQSSEILFRDCVGKAGRHNFIQNWGFGATGIVWLRVTSVGGETILSAELPVGGVGLSEFHHSLATANLIDSCVLEDGWGAMNRKSWSSGAGHTATESVFWNTSGGGILRSYQYGQGYVIGSAPELDVRTDLGHTNAKGTAPEDWVEGLGKAATLEPTSLYDDQLARRLDAGR